METAERNQAKGCPWDDWEDHGGFDDDESLMGIITPERSVFFQVRPWYYENKQSKPFTPVVISVQTSFL